MVQLLAFVVAGLAGVAVGRFIFFRHLPTTALAIAFVGGWLLWMLVSYAGLVGPFNDTGMLFFFSFGVSSFGELLYLSMKRVDELEKKNDRLSRDLLAERRKAGEQNSS